MKVGPNNESPGFIASIKSNSLVHVLLAFVFVVSGLIVNILQAMTMIVWWIGNKDLYRTLNIRLAYLHWALIPFLSEWWAGVKVTLYMKPDDFRKVNKESGIVVLNHKYDMDWVVGWVVGDRVKILGNAKCMAKKALSYVPLLGWSWRFCEYIFVKRNLENDTKTILKAMETLKEFKHYYWMLIFCEGTRYTEKKFKLSMEIAEKKGLKPLKHHLLPRTRGFRMMTQGLRSSASCVYDSTIYVRDNKTPTLIDLLHGKSFDIDFLVIRVPLEEVPDDDEGCAAYLHEMYYKKDCDFDHCTKFNGFPITDGGEGNRLQGFTACDCPRRAECLWIAISWMVLVLSPLFYYIWTLLINGALFQVAAIGVVLLIVSFIFKKIMAQGAVSSSSSSYGAEKKVN
uniref:1-acyl-sn-glycerol-3-phosphate acyltransferase delta-like isoform X1 n=1 Tax=Styela clava TaxID=7725 RepID=UPI00193A7E41|nr:1-acyl-sn-glycerol-3-phosphate acyltransferase delta-like isoform X1 [Styela clava]